MNEPSENPGEDRDERPEARPSERAASGSRPAVAALVILAAIVVIWLVMRDSTPRLTREAFEAGRDRWRSAGVDEYSSTLTVHNPGQTGTTYRVDVRGGRVVRFTMNDREAPANEAYSMAGLFEILERELELASGRGPGSLEGAVLRAEFDPRYGFPRVYKRIAPERKSTFIEVVAFDVPGDVSGP